MEAANTSSALPEQYGFKGHMGQELNRRICRRACLQLEASCLQVELPCLQLRFCSFFTYNWSFFALTAWTPLLLQLELYCLQWESAPNKGGSMPVTSTDADVGLQHPGIKQPVLGILLSKHTEEFPRNAAYQWTGDWANFVLRWREPFSRRVLGQIF